MKNGLSTLILMMLITLQGIFAQTVTIENAIRQPGEITVQVAMTGFTNPNNIGALTLKIEFNDNLLDFTGITNAQLPGTWNANANAGLVSIGYTAPTGSGQELNGKLLDLKFYYPGGFSSDLNFATGCEIVTIGLQPITNIIYTNGGVSQSQGVGTITIGNLTAPAGSTISLPVNIQGTGYGAVNSMTLKIAYDISTLTYTGINQVGISGAVANASGGIITIAWSSITPKNFNSPEVVANILFVYNGGDANVEFFPGSMITENTIILPTNFVNGKITPAQQAASLTISGVAGIQGNLVNVPFVAHNIIPAVAAITLNIQYDHTKLAYAGLTANQLSSWNVSIYPGGKLKISWLKFSGSVINNGDLFTLKFNYINGGYAPISFYSTNEMIATNFQVIPVNYNNGFVNTGVNVSGILKYANTVGSDRPITYSKVDLMTPNGLTLIATTTTDVNGFYEFNMVPPGSYRLFASTTKPWGGAGVTADDATIIRSHALTGSPALTGIYWLAGDVNLTNTITLADWVLVRSFVINNSKPAGWIAPNWIFQTVPINVISSDLSNINILGICSGDVNASYNPILD